MNKKLEMMLDVKGPSLKVGVFSVTENQNTTFTVERCDSKGIIYNSTSPLILKKSDTLEEASTYAIAFRDGYNQAYDYMYHMYQLK